MSTGMDAQTIANIRRAQSKAGIPPNLRKVPYRNICHVLAMHCQTSPQKPFLIFYDEDGSRSEMTYAAFNARVHQAANFLYKSLGLRRGDRVATIAHNHADSVVIYFACWALGAAIAPQNVAEDDRRIAFILRNSEAKICFARAEYMERARRIIHETADGEGAPNIKQIVQVGGQPTNEHIHFQLALRNHPTSFPDGGGADRSALDDEALLVYTSGTTGAPKGVILSQYNLLVDAQGIAQWQAITGNQRLMCVLPIHHVNGIVVTVMLPMSVGGSTVLNSRFSASRFWERVAGEDVNVVSVVPTLLQFLLEYGRERQAAGDTIFGAGINRRDLSHFRHFICGAGTLSVALAKEFCELFGFTVLHGYGLSETTCYSSFLPVGLSWDANQRWLLDHGYPGIGCPIEPNEMAIFSADGSGELLDEGERGEICIRGHNVMQGYFKRPDANAETFRFGWFRSGDEGFWLRGEGGRQFFFITGRIKELINRGGVKFSPLDIEEVLLGINGVKAGLAIAFPNLYYGEEIGAYIVPEDGAQPAAGTILAACRERMPFEKSPKAVVFGSEIPVTSTGKYQRLKLQGLFAEWENTQFRR